MGCMCVFLCSCVEKDEDRESEMALGESQPVLQLAVNTPKVSLLSLKCKLKLIS